MESNSIGNIQLIIGPMYSGKSTELIRRLKRYKIAKKKIILFKHTKDDRFEINNVCTHDKEKLEAFNFESLKLIPNDLLEFVDVIGIDEGQFFSDIVEFSDDMANKGKIIIISALNGSFKKEPFEVIANLIPIVDEILNLSAVCMICGKDAHFSKRITDENETVLIGGLDKYISVCRNCFLKKLK